MCVRVEWLLTDASGVLAYVWQMSQVCECVSVCVAILFMLRIARFR